MKKLTTILFIILSSLVFSQNSFKVSEKIDYYHNNNYTFRNFSFFQKTNKPSLIEKISNAVNNPTILEIDSDEIKRIYQEKPLLIEFSIPYNNTFIDVELYKKDILEDSFVVTNHKGENQNYKKGVYYRGVVKNSSQSLVAFSFFNNGAYGVASSSELGNINIGKLKNNAEYLSFNENNLTGPNPFVCGFDEVEKNIEKSYTQNQSPTGKSNSQTTNCVRVYYEVAYQPFLENNSDIDATVNWVTSVHNNISTLYANDDVQIALSEIMVWTEDDPYDYDYSGNLDYFRNYRTVFNGDLAHLINQPMTTSVAYLNSLCGSYNYAYSGVSQYFDDVPTYSWTILASTHEMGHALGSPHTHSCAWNGNNTAIDGCGPAGDADEGCDGPIPPNGGTIMSYCHLVSVGTNLSNGFGLQPAQLIRNIVDSRPCLGSDCINSCIMSISGLDINYVSDSSLTVTIEDNIYNEWEYRIFPYSSEANNWSYTDTNFITIENLTPNTYYVIQVGNLCSNGNQGGTISKLLLTNGNYCEGDLFKDTGGSNQNYNNNEYLVKTFYPQNNGDYLTLTFNSFDTEYDYDFMTIYDGTSINAPIFPNAENLSGNLTLPPYTATNPDGAITIRFASDGSVTESGWEAEITCNSSLSADNFNKSSIKLYPNPANSYFNISSEELISSITVYDLAGRRVFENQNIKQTQTQVNVQNLTTGAYFVKVNVNGSKQTFKIIKE